LKEERENNPDYDDGMPSIMLNSQEEVQAFFDANPHLKEQNPHLMEQLERQKRDKKQKEDINIDVISTNNNDSCNHNDLNHHHQKKKKKYDGPYNHRLSRRDVFELSTQTTTALITMAVVESPARAVAADSATTTAKTDVDTNASYKILRQLRSVPTFCIVTNDGIPFHGIGQNNHKESDPTNSIRIFLFELYNRCWKSTECSSKRRWTK